MAHVNDMFIFRNNFVGIVLLEGSIDTAKASSGWSMGAQGKLSVIEHGRWLSGYPERIPSVAFCQAYGH